ncbi:DUF6274 family protein [Streptomyces sp. NPDC060030]|uniref:DUF6274 family protein n=1 Tax=Streptomyces sp. NPDC060030 TaxID=3347042 RepID=UPI0036CB7CFB
MSAPTEKHETRALLRAHLAAASGYRHLTHRCPICHRLLRLATEPLTAPQEPYRPQEADNAAEAPPTPETPLGAPVRDTGAPPRAARPRAAGTEAGAEAHAAPSGAGPRGRPDVRPGDKSPPTT